MTPKKIVSLYAKHGSLTRVAEVLHCRRDKVARLFKAGGGKLKRKGRLSVEEIVAMYPENSLSEISRQDGRTPAMILYILQKAGVARLPRGGRVGRPRTTGHGLRAKNLGLNYNRYIRLGAILKLGGSCQLCGNSDLRVLDINHINGEGVETRTTKELLTQCRRILAGDKVPYMEVRCVNCNRIHEYERGNIGLIPPGLSLKDYEV